MNKISSANQHCPDGWTTTTVGKLFEFSYGKGLVKKDRKASGKVPVYGSSGVVGYHDKFLVEGPVIIVGRKGAAGSVNLSLENCWPIDTTYFVTMPSHVDVRFAYHMLWNLRLKQFETSTAIPGLNRDDAYRLTVSLPPLNEQRRIVAKIEALFSELDKGVESLKTAREQLKIYRQVVLKHAFEGKLTARWREENIDKPEDSQELLSSIQTERNERLNSRIKNGDLEAKRYLSKIKKNKPRYPDEVLPDHCRWVNLLEICTVIVDCHNKTAPYQDNGVVLIRTPCIRNGKIHLNDEARFVSEETYAFWSKRCPPEPGDIIFTREAPMGEVGLVPEGVRLCMGQRMMLIRPPRLMNAKFLLRCLMEPSFQARMSSSSVGTGVKHLRVGDVENLCIPLFPLGEQNEIVKQLEAVLSIVDKQELEVGMALCRTENLRQAILKKAFSGQLVHR